MIAWALAAWAAPPEATLPDHGEHVDLFAIEGHGHGFGGLGIVVHDGPTMVLEALTPAGPSLFTVRVEDGQTTIDALDEGLADFLRRLPFDRDLAALYLVDGTERLSLLGWTIVPKSDGWVIKGPKGRARVRRDGEARVLRDRLRGYTLTVRPQEQP
ncbi:MAG: hypothetical protein KC621_33370 [Myxococcales bacterium]|nr:hypothetical protein [Myxococcales bacterium]